MRNDFDFKLNIDLIFGAGRVSELGDIAARFGKTVMMVTCPWPDVMVSNMKRIIKIMENAGLRVVLFDRAVPNPTDSSIDEAIAIAKCENIDVLVAVGGGSAIDSAKAVSVGFYNEGPIWNYTYHGNPILKFNEEKLIPVVAVTTTCGTGSHVTPYSVISSNDVRVKSAIIISNSMFPKAAIVDPELMLTMPPFVTATTGFDSFAHVFESYTNLNSTILEELFALEAIKIIKANLIKACKNGDNLDVRTKMAYADTLSGICFTQVNTTVPHVIGGAIVGKCPEMTHGQSLAMAYPVFLDMIRPYREVEFAKVARIFDPELDKVSDAQAADRLKGLIVAWQKEIGIYASCRSLGLPEDIRDLVIDEVYDSKDEFIVRSIQTRQQAADIVEIIWEE